MKITTAWCMDVDGNAQLLSAYDELTFDSWGGVPDWHLAEIEKMGATLVREIEIEVPDADIYKMFETPVIQGTFNLVQEHTSFDISTEHLDAILDACVNRLIKVGVCATAAGEEDGEIIGVVKEIKHHLDEPPILVLRRLDRISEDDTGISIISGDAITSVEIIDQPVDVAPPTGVMVEPKTLIEVLKEPERQDTYVVQLWEESERGWGVRPDGWSVHLSFEDCTAYIKDYTKDRTGPAPAEYDRPRGHPYVVSGSDLSDERIAAIHASPHGVRYYDNNYPRRDGA